MVNGLENGNSNFIIKNGSAALNGERVLMAVDFGNLHLKASYFMVRSRIRVVRVVRPCQVRVILNWAMLGKITTSSTPSSLECCVHLSTATSLIKMYLRRISFGVNVSLGDRLRSNNSLRIIQYPINIYTYTLTYSKHI